MWIRLTAQCVSGVLLADYHVVRRAKLKLNDLYTSDRTAIYWFRGGVNWRAIVAFIAGAWPFLRKLPSPSYLDTLVLTYAIAGLAETVNSTSATANNDWVRLYHLTFIVGVTISFFVFWGLSYLSPPRGLGEEAPFVDGVFYGVPEATSDVKAEGAGRKVDDKHQADAAVSA